MSAAFSAPCSMAWNCSSVLGSCVPKIVMLPRPGTKQLTAKDAKGAKEQPEPLHFARLGALRGYLVPISNLRPRNSLECLHRTWRHVVLINNVISRSI